MVLDAGQPFRVACWSMDGDQANLRDCVRRALAEDLGGAPNVAADLSSRLAIPPQVRGRARILAKAAGVIAGLDCARLAFTLLDGGCDVHSDCSDGDPVAVGDGVLAVSGPMHALLAAERSALNFLQRLSGIATLTRRYVEAVAATGAKILDTRKTTPGLRALEKQAVLSGGGLNHRIGLFDQVLLKENHFASARPATYEEVVRRCVNGQSAAVVAEARDADEAQAAVRGGAAVVMLDNFEPGAQLIAAVAAARSSAAQLGREVEIEVSGGVDLDSIGAFAAAGVDRISIGALTHSAPALDLSMLVEVLS